MDKLYGKIVKVREEPLKKISIVIADTDETYAQALHIKAVKELNNYADIHMITDEAYFHGAFARCPAPDILAVSSDLYSPALHAFGAEELYVLTDEAASTETDEEGTVFIYKYTAPDELLRKILSGKASGIQLASAEGKTCRIITFYSAGGRTGKTCAAMGTAGCLARSGKRVLYINAQDLQTFQYYLKDRSYIETEDVYRIMSGTGSGIYGAVRSILRTEDFVYVPPFKASLTALNTDFRIYEILAGEAAQSGEYDAVIIDTDHSFNKQKISLLSMSDKVLLVTLQDRKSVFELSILAENLKLDRNDKYLLVCSNYIRGQENALLLQENSALFHSPEYISHIQQFEKDNISDPSADSEFRRIIGMIL